MGLIKKLRNSKKAAGPNEKPAMVKTHLRDMIIVPEMIGSVVGVYVSAVSVVQVVDILIYVSQNGKSFTTVEVKPEMTGHYLGEFS